MRNDYHKNIVLQIPLSPLNLSKLRFNRCYQSINQKLFFEIKKNILSLCCIYLLYKMLNNILQKNMKPVLPSTGTHNTLSSGTLIRGDVFAEEDLRIDAKVEGNIECRGKIVVGPGGIVIGYLRCENAELLGTISGDLFVNGLLTLKSTVNYSGDITVRAIEIEPGASFNGTCRMITEQYQGE